MSHEKRAIVEPGRTPPEAPRDAETPTKEAGAPAPTDSRGWDDHTFRRLDEIIARKHDPNHLRLS